MKKRIFASLLAIVMAFSLLPASALAATGKITITINIFDVDKNTTIKNVGTDYCNKKSSGVQSENYRI